MLTVESLTSLEKVEILLGELARFHRSVGFAQLRQSERIEEAAGDGVATDLAQLFPQASVQATMNAPQACLYILRASMEEVDGYDIVGSDAISGRVSIGL